MLPSTCFQPFVKEPNLGQDSTHGNNPSCYYSIHSQVAHGRTLLVRVAVRLYRSVYSMCAVSYILAIVVGHDVMIYCLVNQLNVISALRKGETLKDCGC